MKQWLAIVEPRTSWLTLSDLDRGRLLACGIAGIDVRLRPGAEDVIRDCVAAGLPWRTHSWEGGRDAANATANVDEAEAMRDAASVLKRIHALEDATGSQCESYGLNAERDWWKGNALAVDALEAFVNRWAVDPAAPDCDYLGFTDPAWHYGRKDWDGDGDVDTKVPPVVQKRFRRLQSMAYQDTFAGIQATLLRARKEWPTSPITAYVSIGALRPDGTIIGKPDAIQRIAVERVAGIDEITHYVGLPESWSRMLVEGNAKVAPLVERIPQIAAACACVDRAS
jgi:hypothetical protein